ncbi:MAG TPA: hypothetical protein VG795_06520, partial [Acidimicrobiia bacterium]|nr:hypothetical protein [Acidimicrobiia bacterium]
LARRNPQRSWMAAALSVVVVMAAGLLTMRPGVVGAAQPNYFRIVVSDAGFGPPIVERVNVGDVLIFEVHETTTYDHTVTFEDHSVCPGNRGAEPCWPELRFDQEIPAQMCSADGFVVRRWRCMIVQEPGKNVKYHDAFKPANGGEIRVLGQATTTTGPATTTTAPTTTSTTRPTTTTTQPPTTVTTAPQTTTSTAPTQIRPFVIPDSPSTTSTIPAVTLTNNTGTTPPAANDKDKDKDKGKDKGKSKAAGTDTPTTVSSAPAAMPPDAVFDPAALTPGPITVPEVAGGPAGVDDDNLASSAVMNLLDPEESDSPWPLVLAIGIVTLLVLVLGVWAWFHRSSRYDPA